ncbi:MAG: [citrate (pro-3S)-lyase] ligase [Thermoplasmata archaeon]
MTDDAEKRKVSSFLAGLGLQYETDVDYTAVIERKGKLIATGSLSGEIIKCVGVLPELQGEGIFTQMASHLMNRAFEKGMTHLFVFTTPANAIKFASLGFNEIARAEPWVALLEYGTPNISDYLVEMKKKAALALSKKIKTTLDEIPERYLKSAASIVVNCNPFTLGHQHLIETAASQNSIVFVFVVSEDRSLFPKDVRFRLIELGTAHLPNVVLIEGGKYIISSATFPRYFTRDKDLASAQAHLDVAIFAKYIVPAFKIKRRYVGEEPYCETTNMYNQAMKDILIPAGTELVIIPRKEYNGMPISASSVRAAIKKDDWETISHLVPKTTLEFLKSKEAEAILEKIKLSTSRH